MFFLFFPVFPTFCLFNNSMIWIKTWVKRIHLPANICLIFVDTSRFITINLDKSAATIHSFDNPNNQISSLDFMPTYNKEILNKSRTVASCENQLMLLCICQDILSILDLKLKTSPLYNVFVGFLILVSERFVIFTETPLWKTSNRNRNNQTGMCTCWQQHHTQAPCSETFS